MPLTKFFKRVDRLIDEIHDAPAVDEIEHVLVPGEMEWKRREAALIDGIKLPPDVIVVVQSNEPSSFALHSKFVIRPQ